MKKGLYERLLKISKRTLSTLMVLGLLVTSAAPLEVFATESNQTTTQSNDQSDGQVNVENGDEFWSTTNEEGETGDSGSVGDTEYETQTTSWPEKDVLGSSDPTLSAPSVDSYISGMGAQNAEDNLYALTVATGITPGSTVHYFAVRYKDSKGIKQTKYLFPHNDAFSNSYNYMNEKGGTNTTLNNRHKILNSLGYTVNDATTPSALSSWSVDEYLFKADNGLSEITGIEVFMSGGSWSVQGMTVSKVTSVAGYGEYGFYSGKYFFGIGKQKICELQKKKSGTLTLSAKGDTLFNIGGAESVYFELKKTASDDGFNTPFDDVYSFRMDFADNLESGLESYLRGSGADTSLSSGPLVEDIALSIEYKDSNGWTRNVTMPVLLSVVGQSMEFGDNLQTIGIAQRGDTIAFSGLLPDYASLVSSRIYVGEAARTQLAATGGFSATSGGREALTEALNSDSISLVGISGYEGTSRMSNIGNGTDVVTGETLQGLSLACSFSQANPIMYQTTTNSSGYAINAGGNFALDLKAYNSKDPLIGVTNDKNYLVRLKTDSMERAATASDISVRLTYLQGDGSQNTTSAYSAMSEVQKFLGYWPSTAGATENYAYLYGTCADGILEFPISVPEISGFKKVEISLGSGNDDWQMQGFSVAYIPSIGERRIYLQPSSAQGDTSSYRIVRTMQRVDIPPFPLGVTQHFDGGQAETWDVDTGTNYSSEGVDYESMRYSMTYEQTKQNFGFTTARKLYDVTVDVADDADSANGNGDSGSNNQFFFQLQFKNGNSAVVLANQQLSADGFRTGYKESFTIATNRDYGNLTGIRIIPDDQAEDSEIFDKLNIDSITVTEQSNGGAALQYTIDHVGWVDIDYRDSMEAYSLSGSQGRTIEQLSSNYTVTSQRHVVNLLCEVATLPWEIQDYLQVQASIACDISYIDTDDQPQTMSFDMVSRMAAYMNMEGTTYEIPDDSTDSTAKYYKNMGTVSDPDWMLRPNHTDRFILPAIPNLKSLKSMTIYATSRNNLPGQWVIGSVNVSQINEDGAVRLTSDNEYYRDLKTSPLCAMSGERDSVSLLLPAGTMESTTIWFTDNTLVWADDSSWVSPVTRLPDSSQDTMNIYLYPTPGYGNIAGNTMNAALQYTVPFGDPQQVTDTLQPYASGTTDACFVGTGLRAYGMQKLSSISVQCSNPQVLLDHAVIQHVRDSVVVETYYVAYNKASAIYRVTMRPSAYTQVGDPREQEILLSFGTATEAATLFAEQNDIAVAFKYRSSLDHGQSEYYSPYMYLTDAGIGRIYPGMMAEVDFNIPYVSEITGYRIVSFGNINATVEGALISNYSYSGKHTDETTGETITDDLIRNQSYSICRTSGGEITPVLLRNEITEYPVSGVGMTGAGTINPLDLTFTTTEAQSMGESGTSDPVKMTFTYTDHYGATRNRVIYDAAKYIQTENGMFRTGTGSRLRLFLPECSDLVAITIEPYSTSGFASWSLASISGSLSLSEKQINRAINATYTQDAPGVVYLKEVNLQTFTSVDGGASQAIEEHLRTMSLTAGQVITFKVTAGFNVSAVMPQNDGTLLDVTANTVANVTEAGFTFTVPANTTTESQMYRIYVKSSANPSIYDLVEVNVAPTPATP